METKMATPEENTPKLESPPVAPPVLPGAPPQTTRDRIRYKDAIQEIECLIRSRHPLIYVVTHEEGRFIQELYERIIKPYNKLLFLWSQYQGIVPYIPRKPPARCSGEFAETNSIGKALTKIEEFATETVASPNNKSQARGVLFLMRDAHTVLVPPIPRQIRDIYEHLVATRPFGKSIIIVAPFLAHGQKPGIEPTLEKQMAVVNYTLPTREQIEEQVRDILTVIKAGPAASGKAKVDYTDEELFKFSRVLQGLTKLEIDNAIAASLAHLWCIDIDKLVLEKRQIIRKSDILEFIDVDTTTKDIGGLDEAKKFFAAYGEAFTPEAIAFGVEPLKGVLLTGVPGGGKSLLAKAVGNLWNLPTLKLDVGKVMAGIVGSSEQRMREVILQAEGMAPCCLWLDEVEKSLSGTKSSNASDAGTLSRVFGTLLTAMQEGLKGVVVLATANDVTALPPEFIRRFNEVFFVDLPTTDERREIFEIHLRKKKRDPKAFDMTALLAASQNYTGAEIEKAIAEAIARAFSNGRQPLTTHDLLNALESTKPIYTVMGEKITQIRDWARGRARYASSQAAALSSPGNQRVTTKSGKTLKVDDALGDLGEETAIKQKKKKATLDTDPDARAKALAESLLEDTDESN